MLYEKFDYILTVAEELNLTRAAKRLYISQPTLTQYINRLEAELGVQLFDRSKTPISITEAGHYYIEEMKKISFAERNLRSNIQRIDNPRHSLIIGIGQVRGSHWIPLVLPAFCEVHPDVNIQVVQYLEANIADALEKGEIDLGIGVFQSFKSNLNIELLVHEKLFLVAHKKFGLIPESERKLNNPDHLMTISPSLLTQKPFIIPHVGNGLYSAYEQLISIHHIQPSRTIAVNNLSTGLRLVMKGLGIQLISGPVLQAEHYNKDDLTDLDFFTVDNMLSTRVCTAVYSPDNKNQSLIQDFIRILRSELDQKQNIQNN